MYSEDLDMTEEEYMDLWFDDEEGGTGDCGALGKHEGKRGKLE